MAVNIILYYLKYWYTKCNPYSYLFLGYCFKSDYIQRHYINNKSVIKLPVIQRKLIFLSFWSCFDGSVIWKFRIAKLSQNFGYFCIWMCWDFLTSAKSFLLMKRNKSKIAEIILIKSEFQRYITLTDFVSLRKICSLRKLWTSYNFINYQVLWRMNHGRSRLKRIQ